MEQQPKLKKGERYQDREGYWKIDGKYEHRLIWRREVGPIPKGWIIHHVNHDKSDNRIENLVCLPPHYHNEIHQYHREYGVKIDRETLLKDAAEFLKQYEQLLSQRGEVKAQLRAINARLAVLGYPIGDVKVKAAKSKKSKKRKKSPQHKAPWSGQVLREEKKKRPFVPKTILLKT